ncbi:hypothetical protein BC831DRAFT_181498 [Entophlyctis helioformis]|nr:hypothetical protein BC831DRAFT_181498 [Entophlyctis helioformis]
MAHCHASSQRHAAAQRRVHKAHNADARSCGMSSRAPLLDPSPTYKALPSCWPLPSFNSNNALGTFKRNKPASGTAPSPLQSAMSQGDDIAGGIEGRRVGVIERPSTRPTPRTKRPWWRVFASRHKGGFSDVWLVEWGSACCRLLCCTDAAALAVLGVLGVSPAMPPSSGAADSKTEPIKEPGEHPHSFVSPHLAAFQSPCKWR